MVRKLNVIVPRSQSDLERLRTMDLAGDLVTTNSDRNDFGLPPEVQDTPLKKAFKGSGNPWRSMRGRFSRFQEDADKVPYHHPTSIDSGNPLGAGGGGGAFDAARQQLVMMKKQMEVFADLQELQRKGHIVRYQEGPIENELFGKQQGYRNDADYLTEFWVKNFKGVMPSEVIKALIGEVPEKAGSYPVRVEVSGNKVTIASDEVKVFGVTASITRDLDFGIMDAHHSWFKVADGEKAKGAASSMMENAIPLYKKLGMKTLSVYANLDAGGYVWGRFGFKADRGDFGVVFETGINRLMKRGTMPTLSADAQAEWDKLKGSYTKDATNPDLPHMITGTKTPYLDKELAPMIEARMQSVDDQVPRTFIRAALYNQSWEGKIRLDNQDDLAVVTSYIEETKKKKKS